MCSIVHQHPSGESIKERRNESISKKGFVRPSIPCAERWLIKMTIAFACYNKNEQIRMRSSSGGFYYTIAKKVITSGGVVYGACYEGTDVCHRRIDTIGGILPSCGSKYLPSKLGDTFKQIQADLNSERMVLFTGLPCQCKGVLSLIGERDNLYCADCVCHGIPSKTAWKEYLSSMRHRGFDVEAVNMRDKVSGWRTYSWKLKGSNGEEIIQSKNENLFMKGFTSDLYLRPSCYECCFKGIDRQTDFTLGDYWGVWDIQPEIYDDKGTSLVLVHSNKGMLLFQDVEKELEYREANIRKAVQSNRSIIQSAHLSKARKEFFIGVKKQKDFIDLVENMTRLSVYRRVKRKFKRLFNYARNTRKFNNH